MQAAIEPRPVAALSRRRWLLALFAASGLLAILLLPRLYGEGLTAGASDLGAALLFTLALLGASLLLPSLHAGVWWGILLTTLLCGAWYAAVGGTPAAWLSLLGYESILLALAGEPWRAAGTARRANAWLRRGLIWSLTSGAGSAVPLLVAQIEGRFSDEEFYVAALFLLVALYLGMLFTLSLLLAPAASRRSVAGRAHYFAIASLLLPALLLVVAIDGYQHSFYGSDAPSYPGISEQSPFLCATLPAGNAPPVRSEALLQQVLDELERYPDRAAPEFGMLALATDDQTWANRFRESLLEDARQGRYSEPAKSVKFFQYEAARRAYYFHHVSRAFPALFSSSDVALIRDWFAGINKRAMTVEWVDWLYALAFREWQEGPYANQEIGNGLIALLVAFGLEEPSLHEANLSLLKEKRGGFQWRWRNSDDTLEYQRVWLDNAFFQELYQEEQDAGHEKRRSLAFEWLLLQMLPDGSVPSYNNPGGTPAPATTMLLGAALTGDPRYLWAAERMGASNREAGYYTQAQPGVESLPPMEGALPDEGSCLIFAEAGLPNQAGPLAPDKIVFRDGWDAESHYLLLNLRFTGWHRYKGSNTLSLLSIDGERLLEDNLSGSGRSWVPEGRRKFRDKQIDRSQLNGLVIPREGMGRVLYALTGLGTPWAQDPPFYASVERFATLPGLDISRTTLTEWQGWSHARTIYFLHGGPIFIVDQAGSEGSDGRATLLWHSAGPLEQRGDTLLLSERLRMESTGSPQVEEGTRTVQLTGEAGRLSHLTTFLPGEWAMAEYTATSLESSGEISGGFAARATTGEGTVTLLHNEGSGTVEHEGLQTDGESLLLRTSTGTLNACYTGGTEITFPISQPPRAVLLLDDASEVTPDTWEWREGRLVVTLDTLPQEGCLQVE